MLCFFLSVRGGVFPSKTDRKDGNRMENPYKDMFIHLYKTMIVLEDVLQKLSTKIGNSLDDSINIPWAGFDELVNDRADIEKQFAKLFDD